MLRQYLFCLAVFVLGTQAGAGDTSLFRMDTGDQNRGWEAVGRLEIDGHGFCTGALIEEDLVLTAAHCLFDKTTGARVDETGIEFRAGWRNGRAEAYRWVTRTVVHPDYEYSGRVATDRVRNDIALLRLERPIRLSSVKPFATDGAASSGERVGVVSYAHDRADAPSLQELCGVIGQDAGVLVTSCDVDFGSSGSPIFSFEDGTARIVSVVSAKADMHGKPVALGTSLSGPLDQLRLAMARGDSVFLKATPGHNGFSQKGERNQTGAKFLRP